MGDTIQIGSERWKAIVPKCPVQDCKEPLVARQPDRRFMEDDHYAECPNGHVWELVVPTDFEPAAIEALEQAIEDEQAVTFLYRKKPNEGGQIRTLSPYEVTGDITESNVKVLGWDHDRDALRSFATNKIVSKVEPADEDDVAYREPNT